MAFLNPRFREFRDVRYLLGWILARWLTGLLARVCKSTLPLIYLLLIMEAGTASTVPTYLHAYLLGTYMDGSLLQLLLQLFQLQLPRPASLPACRLIPSFPSFRFWIRATCNSHFHSSQIPSQSHYSIGTHRPLPTTHPPPTHHPQSTAPAAAAHLHTCTHIAHPPLPARPPRARPALTHSFAPTHLHACTLTYFHTLSHLHTFPLIHTHTPLPLSAW